MESRENVLIVQRGQFLESGAGRVAYRVTDNSAQRISITTGSRSLAAVEVISGLSEGDNIIISSTDQFDSANSVLITQ